MGKKQVIVQSLNNIGVNVELHGMSFSDENILNCVNGGSLA